MPQQIKILIQLGKRLGHIKFKVKASNKSGKYL